jgi:hypothetical protein
MTLTHVQVYPTSAYFWEPFQSVTFFALLLWHLLLCIAVDHTRTASSNNFICIKEENLLSCLLYYYHLTINHEVSLDSSRSPRGCVLVVVVKGLKECSSWWFQKRSVACLEETRKAQKRLLQPKKPAREVIYKRISR